MGNLPTGRRPITAAGLTRLQQELRLLLETTRPALLGATANNDGEARARLHVVEWRIQVLHRLLSLCDPVPTPAAHPERVGLGTRVRVQDEDGSEHVYALVGPDELDGGRGLVSHASPLGRALLGLEVGAWGTIERPAGIREVRVLAIEPL